MALAREAVGVAEHGCVEFGVVDDDKRGVSQQRLELSVDLGEAGFVGEHVSSVAMAASSR